MSRGRLAAVGIMGTAAVLLSACSSAGSAAQDSQVPSSSAQTSEGGMSSALKAIAPQVNSTPQQQPAPDALERAGAEFAAELEGKGMPAPENANHATLAQVARGICGQLAAGTPEATIREQLRPVTLYAVAQSGGTLDEARAAQIYLDAARAGC